MADSGQLRDIWKRFWWPSGQWERTQLLHLRENKFQNYGERVRRSTNLASSAPFYTDHIEDGGNKLRTRESAHSAGMMLFIEKAHQLHSSCILENFGLCPLNIDARDRMTAAKKLPKGIFKASLRHEHSIKEDFDKMSVAALDWFCTDAIGRSMGFYKLMCYVKANGSATTYVKSWRSLLPIHGHYLTGGARCERSRFMQD